MSKFETVGFGGGCHWCTEAVFQSLRGVATVEQGFIRSAPPAETWSEAARVTFDPHIIDINTLISVHVRTHAATSPHSMRSKYRSAVYTTFEDQKPRARAGLQMAQADFDKTLITEVLPLAEFKPSDAQFQNYFAEGPDRPFCQTYIDPKLARIRREFAHHALPQRGSTPDVEPVNLDAASC